MVGLSGSRTKKQFGRSLFSSEQIGTGGKTEVHLPARTTTLRTYRGADKSSRYHTHRSQQEQVLLLLQLYDLYDPDHDKLLVV